MIKHTIDLAKTVRLIKADTVSQFGEGYRQVSGPTIAEGSATEMIEHARGLPIHERSKIFFRGESGNPMTLEEIEAQIAEAR